MNTQNHTQPQSEALIVVEFVSRLNPGETFTYEQLEKLVGWKSDRKQYQSLMSKARRVLDQEHGILMSAVTNLGYQVLTDQQIVLYVTARTQSLRRAAERLMSQLERCISLGDLSASHKKLYHQCVIILQQVSDSIPVAEGAKTKAKTKPKPAPHHPQI